MRRALACMLCAGCACVAWRRCDLDLAEAGHRLQDQEVSSACAPTSSHRQTLRSKTLTQSASQENREAWQQGLLIARNFFLSNQKELLLTQETTATGIISFRSQRHCQIQLGLNSLHTYFPRVKNNNRKSAKSTGKKILTIGILIAIHITSR